MGSTGKVPPASCLQCRDLAKPWEGADPGNLNLGYTLRAGKAPASEPRKLSDLRSAAASAFVHRCLE